MQKENDRNGFDKSVLGLIQEHGWTSIVTLGSDNGGLNVPLLVYTVGLYENYGHPELLVSGLSSRSAMEILATIVERIKKGETFSHGRVDDVTVEKNTVYLHSVPSKIASDVLVKALLLSDQVPPALQVCWSDKKQQILDAPPTKAKLRLVS